MNKWKKGAYSASMIGVVTAIVIVVNMIAGQVGKDSLQMDLSENHLYEISDISTEVLDKLDKDISIKVIADLERLDSRIERFIKKYAGLSEHIQVEWLDSVKHPSLLQEYDTEGNVVIVSCEETGKTTRISFSEIIQYDYYSYYTTGSMREQSFDGEGQLTSAVNYVSSDEMATIYHTSGHGEGTFTTTVNDLFEKNNIVTKEINLSMNSEIPKDCDLLFLYAPVSDLTEEEKNIISAYLAEGGKVYLILGETEKDTPNLDTLMKEFDLRQADGYAADISRCYQRNPYAIFPILSLSGEMGKGVENNMVLLLNSLALEEVESEEDVTTVSPFMTTSANASLVNNESETVGSKIVGAYATQTIGDSEEEMKTARLTVLGSDSMISSNIVDSFQNLDNLTIFMNSVTQNFENMENISIAAKSLEVVYNTPVHAGGMSVVVIFVIPSTLLIAGFVVWMRRRKA